MRKYLAVLLCAVGVAGYGQSCCCTGAGSNYNILPNLNRHWVGMRYAYKSAYSVYPKSLNPELSGLKKDEYMQTLELLGRFNLRERLQLSVFIPVAFVQQKSKLNNTRQSGLGDMSLLLQYGVLNPMLCNGTKHKHQLRIGAGIKLPTGEFNRQVNGMYATNLQAGTGSVDLLFNAVYTYRYEQFGFNTSLAYRLNTVNPLGVKIGDRLQGAVQAFYVFTVSQVDIMPNVGLGYDYMMFTRNNKRVLDYTGGHYINASAGLDIYYKQLVLSFSTAPAVLNQLNWSGELKNRLYFEAGLYYNFTSTKK